ncbi:hypothetical protein [Salegentibacter sediminis]|uniref:hypothetical protein n=1 Tax=Salegentibacter sediminis TaxID=1930251 RepID=UPI0009BF8440|nr:hypothetical protein [Salegentibacter sediminis]
MSIPEANILPNSAKNRHIVVETRREMNNRGHNNLEYKEGFKIEQEKFLQYKPILLETLQAQDIELITRGMLDKLTGLDATALIEGSVYGVSLRFRSSDYNSFTLNRHISDPFSEVHKWTQNHTNNLKPIYYIQINERLDSSLRLIRINIEAFSYILQGLIKKDRLENYYQPHLESYEFPLKDISYKGIFSGIIENRKFKV